MAFNSEATVVLVSPLRRRFAHPTQQPYRTFFQAARGGRDAEQLAEAERGAAADPRAIRAYREGRTCHPRLPFAGWDACRPAAADAPSRADGPRSSGSGRW